jgi:glucose/arabinose dehydrogenase
MYVNFTNTQGNTVVREYKVSNGRADVATKRDVLMVTQPFANHNGGNLVFGPDGYLYIGLGDGGSAGDPSNNAQNLNTLLGKMLRINPTPSGSNQYQIPRDNPFVGRAGARGEIWAYGLRNPWRYSFDRATKDLWIGDVGQSSWEEVDRQTASSKGGDNYGWSLVEGTHSYKDGPPPNHHPPIYEYSHDGGNCSVTGGYVYRGSAIPKLVGAYLFADFCVGRLRAFVVTKGRAADQRFLGPQAEQLSSFGQDAKGELYVTSLAGGVYRIDPA